MCSSDLMLWVPLLVAALGLVLVLRSWWRLFGVALVLALVTVTAWPMLPAPARDAGPEMIPEGSLTVLSSNVEYGSADVAELARLAEQRVDAIALQEVTPEFLAALAETGLLEEFPHHVGTARGGAAGTMQIGRASCRERV